MIPKEVRAEAKRRILEGDYKSLRVLAKELGISRNTLRAIELEALLPEEKLPKVSRYRRCPGCGGKQLASVPCLICN